VPYKIAVVTDILENPKPHRGAAKYFHNIFTNLAKFGVIVDVYCLHNKIDDKGVLNQIFILTEEEKDWLDKDFFISRGYDFVLTDTVERYSDILIKHSHSAIYRENFVRIPFENLIKKIFCPQRLLSDDAENFIIITMNAHKAIIANSKIAAEDYIKYCKVSPEKVPIINPGINIEKEFSYHPQNIFTLGMNAMSFDMKGGFIFLNALYRLKAAKYDFRAKIIYPNHKKKRRTKVINVFIRTKKKCVFSGYSGRYAKFL
jgi:glycosyltransferase involved in cell wall biosynthesis